MVPGALGPGPRTGWRCRWPLAAASLVAVALSADAPLIQQTFGLTEVGVGAIASGIYLGSAASSVAGGRLTDSHGPGPTLVLVDSCCWLAVRSSPRRAPPVGVFRCRGAGRRAWLRRVNPPTNVLANPRSAGRRAPGHEHQAVGDTVWAGSSPAPSCHYLLALAYGWRVSLALPIGVCLVLAVVFARSCPTPAVNSDLTGEGSQAVRLPAAARYAFGFLMGGVQVAIFAFLASVHGRRRGHDDGHAPARRWRCCWWAGSSGRMAGDGSRTACMATGRESSGDLGAGRGRSGAGCRSVGSPLRYVSLAARRAVVGRLERGVRASIAEAAEPGSIGVVKGAPFPWSVPGSVLIPPGSAGSFMRWPAGRWPGSRVAFLVCCRYCCSR